MLKRSICILLAGIAAGCAGGGSSAPAAAAPAFPANSAPTAAQLAALPPAAPGTPVAAAPSTPLPTIPVGAKFTIYCDSYSGPDHVQFSTQVKNLLVKNTQLKDWYVIHQANQSSLYHGYYAEFEPKAAVDKDAKRDADRAQRDRQLVESIPNPQAPDQKMFPRSMIVPLDAPDPDAPPAWNLANAPGFWSVQVAAFTGPDRKRQTTEAVKQARAMNIPAFYYHGPNVSSVCVGSWERGAVKEQDVGQAGEVGTDKGATEDRDLVVNMSGQDLGDMSKQKLGSDGKPMRVLEAKIEVLDPTLTKTLQEYPAQAVDGAEVPLKGTDKQGNIVMRTRPSMIVQIPRGESTPAEAAQTNEPAPTLINPNAGTNDLASHLRGIGQ